MHIDIHDDLIGEGFLSEEKLKEQSKKFGDYFRDLSANYTKYQASGKWPARPEGLVIVEPLSDADLARA
jgi:hypothetical protein